LFYQNNFALSEQHLYMRFYIKFVKEEEWEEKGEYFGYKLLGCGNKRRVVDKETGKVITEYEI